jgi:hypothetical protein
MLSVLAKGVITKAIIKLIIHAAKRKRSNIEPIFRT